MIATDWTWAASSIAAQVVAWVAYLCFAGVGAALIAVDLREHRLPNRIVLPSLAAALAAVSLASLIDGDPARLLGSVLGGIALGAFYLLLRMLQPGGLGGGDVKLAALIGVMLGWSGWSAVAVGGAAAFALGSVAALTLLVTRRANLGTRIAFGPWMILGAWVGLLVSTG